MGYGFGQGNRSAKAMLSIVLLCALVAFLVVVQLVAFLLGLLLAHSLGKSVDGLFKGVARLSRGEFSFRIRPRGHDQVSQLTTSFNEMAQRLQVAAQERDERLRLEEELRVAREVQMRLLPDVAGFKGVQAIVLPAREVAGDYYDLMRLSDGRLAFLIADVSGKGTSAAFYAAETKGVLAALDKVALDPLQVASRLNAIWCAIHPRRIFMTLVYGVFDPHSGAFAFVRAGHPPVFVRRADGHVEKLSPRGLGIGLSTDRFESLTELRQGVLEPGDALICYTDGLSEAQDPSGDLFGEPRLESMLAGSTDDPQESILGRVSDFTAGRPLDDDLTLLIIRR
jgi:sigma-B regulation protein RsbU (phosphoserine phosphatase)